VGQSFYLEREPAKVVIEDDMALIFPVDSPTRYMMAPAALVEFCESALVEIALDRCRRADTAKAEPA